MTNIKKIFAFLFMLIFMFTLFVPVYADGVGTELVVEPFGEEETETEEELTEEDRVILSVEVSPERVMDYSKMYHLATVTLNECAKIKWYLLTENGAIYNGGYKNDHHGNTYEILWNSLDLNGKHPDGEWNNPTSVRFSLVIIATGINGVDDTYETWFTYTWYDSETSPVNNAPAAPTTAPTSKPSSDVPHTGL